MTNFNLIIVGAGPFGLIAAHTWLETNADHEVAILEGGPDIGGVWAKSRVYPTMMTQSPQGMLEFSCFPMERLPEEETFHGNYPARHVNTYLEAFSMQKKFSGTTVKDRIVFNDSAKNISKSGKMWNVETDSGRTYVGKKLIIATGLTSLPNMPSFPMTDSSIPVFHHKDLASKFSLLSSPEHKNILVLGGAKSSFDAITLLSSLDSPSRKSLTWVIRRSGQGPALLAVPSAPWPHRNSHDIIATRLISKMSPCIFEPSDNYSYFFHTNVVGRWLVDFVWWEVNRGWVKAAGYDKDDNMEKLRPERPVFWSGDGIAVHNSEGMWGAVAKARVLRDEVVGIEGREVMLQSAERVNCDAVICCTGWKNWFPFFDAQLARRLGLPLHPTDSEKVEVAVWEERISKADAEVVRSFPRLENQPNYPDHTPKSTSSRLYRGMIPITGDEDHSIAFIGNIGTTQSFTVAEVQSLWATTYLSGKLPLPAEEEMEHQVALATAWRRRRYLGDGYTFILEQLQYTSMLLRDMGLNDLRKGGGWREILEPYECTDYKDMLGEWKKLYLGKTKDE